VLEESVPVATLETAQLLTTELVTNSARHTGKPQGAIDLSIRYTDDCLRVVVADEGAGFDVERGPPRPDAGSGWGLWLVGEMASRWGVLRDPTRVWFELDLPPAVSPG
jgi:anti-sigma regulatory factor (Ser/Thr protein kinase)